MRYPQCYIFLDENSKLPSLSVLQAWFGPKSEVYLQGVSTTSKTLESRITLLQQLHRIAFKKADYQMHCIAFRGTSVSTFFMTAHGESILKVYWIDSPEQAKSIKGVARQIENVAHFRCLLDLVEQSYRSMSNYIYAKTGQSIVGDTDIHRFFIGRHWGSISEAEIHINQIAKNETRAGVLQRLDLD
jgi:hypothetical protein